MDAGSPLYAPEPQPSTVAPRFLIAWFVLCTSFLLFGKNGSSDIDVGELALGVPFLVTYPFFLAWLLVRSAQHLKNYRSDPDAPPSSHARVLVWCFAAIVYAMGAVAFVALEVFGLKGYLR